MRPSTASTKPEWVREDGRCLVCEGRRGRLPKNAVSNSRAQLKVLLADDPFCCVECCRTWHETELVTQAGKASQAEVAL